MGAALNGMALHGGLRVFGGTFFVFSDYLRPAIRLAALMGLPVTYVFTHDSIAVGEDGPTHEPVEQLASLRAMPNLSVIRPADGNETAAAWKLAVSSTDKPTALVLTRQNLPTIDQAPEKAYEGVEKGGYVVVEAADAQPEALLLASGSEVGLAIEAQKALEKKVSAHLLSAFLHGIASISSQTNTKNPFFLKQYVHVLQLKWVLHLAGSVTLVLMVT